MKKLLILTAALLASPLVALANPIAVTVNGQPVPFDQPPVSVGGRVLVPVRGVFQGLGATVTWNPGTRTVTAIRGQELIVLPMGSTVAQVDGRNKMLDQPAQIIGGRTLVPLRFVGEALGAFVQWIPSQNLVAVTSAAVQNNPLPQSYAPPAYRYPLVEAVRTNTDGPVFAGQELRITLSGDTGGQASFTVPGHRPEPMIEVSPGHYEGTYVVRDHDNNAYAWITGMLQMPDGEVGSAWAPQSVALFGFTRHAVPYWQPGHPVFRAITVPTGVVWFGDSLRLAFEAAPGGSGYFWVGGVQLPVVEQRPGYYVANWSPPETSAGAAPVMVSFAAPGQAPQQVMLQQPIYVASQNLPHGQFLGGVQTTPPAQPGQPMTVHMTAVPGAQATFNVGPHQNIPMREVSPGQYEGQFTPPPGQAIENAEVTAHVAVPHGPQANAPAAGPRVTLAPPAASHVQAAPFHPVTPPPPAPKPLQTPPPPRPMVAERPPAPVPEKPPMALKPPAPAELRVQRVALSRRVFHEGDTIEVTAQGSPHAAPSLRVGSWTVPMREVSPGNYLGQVRVPHVPSHTQLPVQVEVRQGSEVRPTGGGSITLEPKPKR